MPEMKEALKRAKAKSQDIVLNITLQNDEGDRQDREAGLAPMIHDGKISKETVNDPKVIPADEHEAKEAAGIPVPEGEYLGDPMKKKYLDKMAADEAIEPEQENSGLPEKQDPVGLALLAGEEENKMRGLGGLRDKVKHGIRISMGKK